MYRFEFVDSLARWFGEVVDALDLESDAPRTVKLHFGIPKHGVIELASLSSLQLGRASYNYSLRTVALEDLKR